MIEDVTCSRCDLLAPCPASHRCLLSSRHVPVLERHREISQMLSLGSELIGARYFPVYLSREPEVDFPDEWHFLQLILAFPSVEKKQ